MEKKQEALKPFIEFLSIMSKGDVDGQINPESARALFLVGLTRFENLLARKKLALFLHRAELSLKPHDYPTELYSDDTLPDDEGDQGIGG